MEIVDIVTKHLGHMGRMLSGFKSGYLDKNPGSRCFFNGFVYDSKGTKLWFGDIDLTKDMSKLQALATELGSPMYVTREMPFRFTVPTLSQLDLACLGEHPSVVRIAVP